MADHTAVRLEWLTHMGIRDLDPLQEMPGPLPDIRSDSRVFLTHTP